MSFSAAKLYREGELRFGPVCGIEIVVEDANDVGVPGEWCWKVVDEGMVMDSANDYCLSIDALNDACDAANIRLEAKAVKVGDVRPLNSQITS